MDFDERPFCPPGSLAKLGTFSAADAAGPIEEAATELLCGKSC